MNCLVTGGMGYIGQFVVQKLLDQGHTVHVVDNLSTGRRDIPFYKDIMFWECDILDGKQLETVFLHAGKIDCVFHLAARTSVEEGEKMPNEYSLTNVEGSAAVAELAEYYHVPKFVFASSAAVYGDQQETCFEHTALKPISVYASTKLEAEITIRSIYKGQFIAARFFNVAGADIELGLGDAKNPKAVIPQMCLKAISGESLIINGSGEQVRDFMHVSDLAADLIDLAKSDYSGAVNIGSGKGIAILDIANIVAKMVKTNNLASEVQIIHNPPRDADIFYSVASNTLLESIVLTRPPYIEMEDVIKSELFWRRKNNLH